MIKCMTGCLFFTNRCFHRYLDEMGEDVTLNNGASSSDGSKVMSVRILIKAHTVLYVL